MVTMRMTKRIAMALGVVGVAAGLGGVALAQQDMGMNGAMRAHDPFGSATVTRAEAQAKAAEMFARLDVDGDGKLDAADRMAAMSKRFDAMDANHDGVLSRQEFLDAHQKMMGRMAGMQPGHEGGMMHHSGGMGRGMRMLGRMDANGDHAISRDEFIAGALKRFDAADADHDGKLTPDERRAAMRLGMKHHMQHMGGMGSPDMAGHEMPGHDMDDMPPPPPAH